VIVMMIGSDMHAMTMTMATNTIGMMPMVMPRMMVPMRKGGHDVAAHKQRQAQH